MGWYRVKWAMTVEATDSAAAAQAARETQFDAGQAARFEVSPEALPGLKTLVEIPAGKRESTRAAAPPPGPSQNARELVGTPTRYAVSAVPDGDRMSRYFTLTVERRRWRHPERPEAWVVLRDGYALTSDDQWEPERRSGWGTTRYYRDLEDALAAAREWAPRVEVSGFTAVTWLAHERERLAEAGGATAPQG